MDKLSPPATRLQAEPHRPRSAADDAVLQAIDHVERAVLETLSALRRQITGTSPAEAGRLEYESWRHTGH